MLKPKCIPEDDTNDALQMSQCLGHSAEGFLLPCCWIDSAMPRLRDHIHEMFYQDKFKISNVENIREITQSKEWTDFYTMLQENPEKAPKVCKRYCSTDYVGDKYGEE